MRNLLISLFVLASATLALAEEVSLKCWATGEAQTEENIIYQNNSFAQGFVMYDGIKFEFDSSITYCANKYLPDSCLDQIYRGNGNVIEVDLDKEFTMSNGTEAFTGRLYEVEITEVFCKRRVLSN